MHQRTNQDQRYYRREKEKIIDRDRLVTKWQRMEYIWIDKMEEFASKTWQGKEQHSHSHHERIWEKTLSSSELTMNNCYITILLKSTDKFCHAPK